MNEPTGELAFPERVSGGMSLRDYASLQILSAMITSTPVVDRTTVNKKLWAKISFDWADVWLEERRTK